MKKTYNYEELSEIMVNDIVLSEEEFEYLLEDEEACEEFFEALSEELSE